MNRWTELVHFDPNPGDPFMPNVTPIYQTATFTQECVNEAGKYDYSRSGNPTRTILEQQLAKIEQAKFAFAFASGMAALNTLVSLFKTGDHIIAGDELYGGTFRLLEQRLPDRGIQTSWVDTTDLSKVAEAITNNTRIILIETPSNPRQKITDIAKLADLAHQNNLLLAVDNSFLSPWLQQPLILGADLVIHSATKHLSGHSDLTAGTIMTNNAQLAKKIGFIQNAEGNALAPFESWLLIRGLKTLGLRIERQQSSAQKIANYLIQQTAVIKKVYYAGLVDHPGYMIQQSQARGGGTVLSFETGSLALSQKLVDNMSLFKLSVSFGSLSSLVSLPAAMSHAVILDKRHAIAPDLIRLSIGIEDENDLIADLSQALQILETNEYLVKLLQENEHE